MPGPKMLIFNYNSKQLLYWDRSWRQLILYILIQARLGSRLFLDFKIKFAFFGVFLYHIKETNLQAVFWSWLILVCENKNLNFQEFCELIG
jgi:hypothetical protein